MIQACGQSLAMTPEDPPRGMKVTAEWVEMVRLRLREEWGAQTRLARRIGCSPSAISALLTRPTSHSTLVEPISRELGLPLPRPKDLLTEEEKDLLDLWRSFRDGRPSDVEAQFDKIRVRLVKKDD